jgi:hypothetical protein
VLQGTLPAPLGLQVSIDEALTASDADGKYSVFVISVKTALRTWKVGQCPHV